MADTAFNVGADGEKVNTVSESGGKVFVKLELAEAKLVTAMSCNAAL